MAKKKNSNRYYNDIALKMAQQLFGLEYLHYGYFKPGMSVSMNTLPEAQKHYVEALLDTFPSDVNKVFDVGCGAGGVATKLLSKGYQVTCLDPNPYMIETTLNKTQGKVKAYNEFYENIEGLKAGDFDLVLMSESCQYIDPNKGWQMHKHYLRDKGYVLAADFFKMKPIDAPYISKSGHDYENFLKVAESYGFKLINKIDITKEVAPTMDIYQAIITDKIFPVMGAVFSVVERRFPKFYKFLSFLFKNKILFLKTKYSHQSSEEFTKYKSYFILLFQKNE